MSVDGKPAVWVAVASTDGKHVDAHFAAALRFHIFRLASPHDEPVLEEVRELGGGSGGGCSGVCGSEGTCGKGCSCGVSCGGGDGMARALNAVGDCHFVLAKRIGPGALQAILERGLRADIFDGPIPDAFVKLRSKPRFLNLKPKVLRQLAEQRHGQ